MIIDEELHATAVKTVIQAELDTIGTTEHPQAYELDGVPSERPDDYVTVNLYRRYGGESRLDGFIGTCGYRIETQAVSKNLSAARRLRKAVSDALLNVNLTVSGELTTPVLFETEDAFVEDDDYYAGQTDYTYRI